MENKRKCNTILLHTNKAKNCFLINSEKKIRYINSFCTQAYLQDQEWRSYHLYIVSDEEIKEDDWCIETKPGRSQTLCQADKDFVKKDCKKIIATTDMLLIRENDRRSSDSFDLTVYTDREFVPKPCLASIDIYMILFQKNNEECLVEYKNDIVQLDSAGRVSITELKSTWSKKEVENVIKSVLEATGYEIRTTMHGVGSNKTYIEYNGADLENWIKRNL